MTKAQYQKYLASPEWKTRRRVHIDQAGQRCQLCNSNGELHVHHRTYDNVGHETWADLVVLCARCHKHFHDPVDERANIYRVPILRISRDSTKGQTIRIAALRLLRQVMVQVLMPKDDKTRVNLENAVSGVLFRDDHEYYAVDLLE